MPCIIGNIIYSIDKHSNLEKAIINQLRYDDINILLFPLVTTKLNFFYNIMIILVLLNYG